MAQSAPEFKNPSGLDGVEFVEFTGPNPRLFEELFQAYGFKKVGKAKGREIELYRQGDISFIVNTDPSSQAFQFSKLHGPSISSTGFRVKDAVHAFRVTTSRGGRGYLGADETRTAPFPAIFGIGESLIYFVDEANRKKLYTDLFQVSEADRNPKGHGLNIVDHFTNNVPIGEMQKWCDFYTNVLGFRETRYFDIKGAKTGLISKVMRSPCNKFAVPINEPKDGKSQIQEYLDEYKGSGIQHVALTTENIVGSIQSLRGKKLEFLTPPPLTYYKMLKDRLPGVKENLVTLEKEAILVDGDHDGYLLQIFSKNIVGPIFFEIIQRQGHEGFGEGNFQALFDAIERDQTERGYL